MKRTKKKTTDSTQSLEDVVEMQKHLIDPGYYIGTGRVPPHVSAPGDPKPLGIFYLLAAGFFVVLDVILIFSDVRIASSGLIESDIANNIITMIIFGAIALFCLLMGLAYFRKAKKRARKPHPAKRKR